MNNLYLEIQGRKIGIDFPPLVIAEIGINHNGDLNLAKDLIDAATFAGFDAVKFQKRSIASALHQMLSSHNFSL